jgi:hypothetical protein
VSQPRDVDGAYVHAALFVIVAIVTGAAEGAWHYDLVVQIEQLVPAEPGWKAVFKEPDGSETLSRILGWAVVGGTEPELVGVIVDPSEPSRIVAAAGAASPDGGSFARYRFVPPPQQPVSVTMQAPAEQEKKSESDEDPTTQIAKTLLKRRRL